MDTRVIRTDDPALVSGRDVYKTTIGAGDPTVGAVRRWVDGKLTVDWGNCISYLRPASLFVVDVNTDPTAVIVHRRHPREFPTLEVEQMRWDVTSEAKETKVDPVMPARGTFEMSTPPLPPGPDALYYTSGHTLYRLSDGLNKITGRDAAVARALCRHALELLGDER